MYIRFPLLVRTLVRASIHQIYSCRCFILSYFRIKLAPSLLPAHQAQWCNALGCQRLAPATVD